MYFLFSVSSVGVRLFVSLNLFLQPALANCMCTMPNQTRLVIEDYVLYKIVNCCSSNSESISRLKNAVPSLQTPSRLNKAVRKMVDKHAYENDAYFSRIFSNVKVTAELDVVQQLSTVATQLFELPLKPANKNGLSAASGTELDDSHIKWGQVITLLIFASNFAVKAVECNALEKVDDIITWLTQFIDTELSFWLAKQGGWNDFYHWSEATIGHKDPNTNDSCASSATGFSSAMSVGVVAACAGLLFMITQK